MGTVDDLKARISAIQAALAALEIDQPAAFAKFKQILLEANETQAILLVAGIVNGLVGAVSLPVTLIPGKFGPSAIQADFMLPPSMTFVSAVLGPIPTSEGKSLQTSMVGNAVRVIVVGLNQTVITEGLDFTLNLRASIKGSYAMAVQNPFASDPNGVSLPICVTSGVITAQ